MRITDDVARAANNVSRLRRLAMWVDGIPHTQPTGALSAGNPYRSRLSDAEGKLAAAKRSTN